MYSEVLRAQHICIFIGPLLFPFLILFSLIQGFNCADLRNVCTEAGMFAIRAMRDYVNQDDFMKVG